MEIEVKKLTPELLSDWLEYFDNTAFSDEISPVTSAPAFVKRSLSFPSWSISNRCPSCFTIAILSPCAFSFGINLSKNVVLPVPEYATKDTIGISVCSSFSNLTADRSVNV